MSPRVNLIKLLVFISNAAANKLEHFIFTWSPDWFNACNISGTNTLAFCSTIVIKKWHKHIKPLVFVSDAYVNKLEHFFFTCFPDWFNACNISGTNTLAFCITIVIKKWHKHIKLLVFFSDAVDKLEHLVFTCFPDWFNVCNISGTNTLINLLNF